MTRSVDGVDWALSRLRRASAQMEIERHVAHQILVGDDEVRGDPRRAPGDYQALRGLPTVRRGIGGAIPGTRPDKLRL